MITFIGHKLVNGLHDSMDPDASSSAVLSLFTGLNCLVTRPFVVDQVWIAYVPLAIVDVHIDIKTSYRLPQHFMLCMRCCEMY